MSEETRRRWKLFHRDRSAKKAGQPRATTTTPTESSPFGLKVEIEGQDPIVDIVIVHGLNGHREKTWTASNGVHWPRDLLSSDIPNARILSWGFHANTHGSRVSCMYLYDHARQLVSDLCLERNLTQTSTRPIIFVAHSLGGIVVKSALIHADAARDGALKEHRSIKTSTYGIIFMGTPHQGGSGVQLGKLLVNVASVFVTADTRLLSHLERDSEWLQQQLGQYGPISGDFVTKFAYEVYETRTVMGHSLMVVPRASAVVPGAADAELIAIHADHINMVKFVSKEGGEYQKVMGHLRLMAEDANGKVGARWEAERRVDVARLDLRTDVSQAFWTVPFHRNDQFVGRKEMLAWLHDRIPPNRANDRCQRIVINGLGGIGKTQLALEAVFRVRGEEPSCSVFWVPMVSVASFENAYRDVGRQLRVPGIDEEKADVKKLVKNTLEADHCGPWLLVLDNADDMELLFGEKQLCGWFPTNCHGSILITTRHDQVRIRLDIPQKHTLVATNMSDHEAVQMLTDRLGLDQRYNHNDIVAICHSLVNLPLALKQAAAYMETTGITAAKYLRYCQTSDDGLTELLKHETDMQEGRYNGGISNAVATTWLISFTHIARDQPLAADVLRMAAWLIEKDVPVSMLLQDGINEMELDKAVGTLRNYAFITLHKDGTSFDVHRLVQIVTQNWIRQQLEEDACFAKVFKLLAQAYPFTRYENRELWQRYLPHAARAISHAAGRVKDVNYERLLFNLASSSSYLGKYPEAEKMYQETLVLRKERLGTHHPEILDSINGLASVLQQQRKYLEAEKMYQEILDIRRERLGLDHFDTLASMNNLASVIGQQGKYLEAEKIHREILDLIREQRGADHPVKLASMNNLALVLRQQGKYLEAEKLHRGTLDLIREQRGADHPSTLASMNNLALVLRQEGKYLEAEKLHRETLDLRREQDGVDHPSTLNSMNHLAEVLRQQGKYLEAEKIH